MSKYDWRGVLTVLILLGSVTEFSIRGPLRSLQNGTQWNDFLSPFIQARAWANGKDPYSTQSLLFFWPRENRRPFWVDEEAARGTLEKSAGIPSPYPILSLVVFSPFVVLPWPLALRLWIALNTGAVAMAIFAMLCACGCTLANARSKLFLAAAFALAPFHSGLATANPAMLAIALGVGSFFAFKKEKKKTAAFLLALAICVKPTVAAGLWLYFAIRREWRISILAVAIIAIIAGVGVSRLAVAGIPWLDSYSENTRQVFGTGSVDDFTDAAPLRFNMVNLKVAIYQLVKDVATTNFAVLLLTIFLAACWLWLCRKHRTSSDLLEISAISLLSLLAIYHRFYDAALLIWPLAWGLLIVRRRSVTILTCLMIVPFLIPGASLLDKLTAADMIPATVTGARWWNTIVMPHQAWDLVLMCVLLLHWMNQRLAEQNSTQLASVREPATV